MPPPWDEAAACQAIRRIADAAQADYQPGLGWHPHPLDDPMPPAERFDALYFGVGGVVWALQHLARAGAIDPPPDFGFFVITLRDANRPSLADGPHGNAAFPFDDGGLDLLHRTVHPSEALARRLFDTVLDTCELTIPAARLRAASALKVEAMCANRSRSTRARRGWGRSPRIAVALFVSLTSHAWAGCLL